MTALLALLTLALAGAADARVGNSSTGGRGLRSLLPAPMTRMWSRPAKSFERARPAGKSVNRPGVTTTTRAIRRPGFVGGLVAGFIGAGVLGFLFGNGFFAGIGGVASLIGLFAQIALFAFVGWLAWGWWQRRASPAFAGLSPRQLADAYDRPRGEHAERRPAAGGTEVDESDHERLDRLLGEIQAAYGCKDMSALRARVTPEMLAHLSGERAVDAPRGLLNRIKATDLLDGELVRAWREQGHDCATIAVRRSPRDRIDERTTDRMVEDEITEMWTFVRARGGDWLLSAIRQA